MEYEERYGGIVLDPSSSPHEPQNGPNVPETSSTSTSKDTFYFSVKNPHASSPHYIGIYYKKAHLIIRMLEFRIGQELMMQVSDIGGILSQVLSGINIVVSKRYLAFFND